VNVAIDFRRHEWRRPLVGVADETAIGARVRAAIEELTPEHRAVILLREVEGLSYEEISRVMECAKGTVMSRLHDARKKLQVLLKDCL
jgi:RNA polymerase sigma-70 factor (ECF subfamily)